jgi:predicted enzyme related to lactoylglutathione lyase
MSHPDSYPPWSLRESYPAGVPCWIETLQPDVPAALNFYGPLFGWEFDGPVPTPGGSKRQYYCDDADAIADHAARLGGIVIVPPYDNSGFRNAVLADPQGATFSVSQQTSDPTV